MTHETLNTNLWIPQNEFSYTVHEHNNLHTRMSLDWYGLHMDLSDVSWYCLQQTGFSFCEAAPKFGSIKALHFNIILPLRVSLQSGSFPSSFPTNILYALLFSHVPRPSHISSFDHPNNVWWGIQGMMYFFVQRSKFCVLTSNRTPALQLNTMPH